MASLDFKTVNSLYEEFIQNNDPGITLMHFNDQPIKLLELKGKVCHYTNHLAKLGVKTGDCVGYTTPSCPENFYLLLAISRLGAIAVPLFHMIPDISKTDTFKKSGAHIIVTTSQQYPSLNECSVNANAEYKIITIDACLEAGYDLTIPIDDENDFEYPGEEISPSLPLMKASSSGTTGIPKSVIFTQSNIASEILASMSLIPSYALKGNGESSCSIAFPLSTTGIVTILGLLFGGVCLNFSSDVSPIKYLQILSKWKSDIIAAPPSYFEAILSLPSIDSYDLSNVKTLTSGMDFLSPSLVMRIKNRFVNLEGYSHGYGLTETTNVVMVSKAHSLEELKNPPNVMKLIENCGNIIDVMDENGARVPVGSEGELYIKGLNVVNGYPDNPSETGKCFVDGWFKTGDIVRNEGNNTITLLGRKKYLIKRGGKSISPIVVQDTINTLDGVKDSAVVGVPHHLYGEMVVAFIVKNEGSDMNLRDIMRHFRSSLPSYMVPDQIAFIDKIPKNAGVGKVDYESLKKLAEAEYLDIEAAEK
ncbi:MAG TPA: class I adenylate-forming enzyme family protein [Clostridia bacterium]